MNVPTALHILQPPLIFGNPKQISAVRFIEKVDEAKEAAAKCGDCFGTGGKDDAETCLHCDGNGKRDGLDCKACEGTGEVDFVEPCHCLNRFPEDVAAAVIQGGVF